MATRIEWRETRNGELFFLIADRVDGAWSFAERSTWECRWYEISRDDRRIPGLTARATAELLDIETRAA